MAQASVLQAWVEGGPCPELGKQEMHAWDMDSQGAS